MADESRYVSDTQSSIKRKYEEPTYDSTPPSTGTGRRTGFSSGPISPDSASAGTAHPPSYNSVPPPPATDDVQTQVQNAKLRAQEIASRLLSGASAGGVGVGGGGGGGGIGVFDSKRARVEHGGGFDSFDGKPALNTASSIPSSYGYGQGTSKKIDVPNGRVGVIIGKAGETIKYLQLQSGAKIQVTRDMDADPNSSTRTVELMGTPEQIAKAEQLINDVLLEAEAGGSAMVSRRVTDQYGSGDQYVMKVPNNKVGLVIGKGGETIKNMQARTGARIQVIPLHLPPGDTSNERNIHIDGTPEQIEAAKQLINEATSENRMRNQGMPGGYSQHNYQARPPASWGAPGDPQTQQTGYGYGQPGMYSGPSPQYNMGQTQYGSYLPQSSGGYNSSWDQSTVPPSQHGGQGGGYDYYNQQPPQQQQQQQTTGSTGGAADNLVYGYSQPPTSYGQGYSQDGYGGYHGHPSSGYGQPPQYDQQGYNTAGYNTAANLSQEGHTTSYGSQGDSAQAQPAVQPSSAGQQGYGTGYTQAGVQPGYGVLPVSQAGYGSQPPPHSGYGLHGPPQGKPPGNPSPYGQAHQSLSTSGGYGQPPAAYSQPDTAAQHAPPSGYSAGTGQPVYGSAYGPPPTSQPGYGQPPPQYYSGGYQQPAAAYLADGGPAPPTSQAAAPSEAAKASPPPS